MSKRLAWIAGGIVAIGTVAGLNACRELLEAHDLMHAAEAGNVERVRAALERAPNDAGLWELLGDAYHARSDYAQAVGSYQKSLQLDPSDENTWWELGISEVCRQNSIGVASVQDALRRLNGESAKEFAKMAPLGCCAFGGCSK